MVEGAHGRAAETWAPSVSLRLPPPRPGEDLFQRQQLPRRRLVLAHVGDEVGDVAELLLLADVGVQRDLDLAAVKVAVEPEQIGLEQLLRRFEGRADAEAGDAGMLGCRPRASRAPHRCHIWAADNRRGQVGGRIAELAAARVAALDHALDRIVAAQHMGRGGGVAGDQAPRGSGPTRCARRRAAPAARLRRSRRAARPAP